MYVSNTSKTNKMIYEKKATYWDVLIQYNVILTLIRPIWAWSRSILLLKAITLEQVLFGRPTLLVLYEEIPAAADGSPSIFPVQNINAESVSMLWRYEAIAFADL